MLPKFMNISDIGLKNNNCLSVRGIGQKNNSQLSGHLRKGPIKRKTYKKSNSEKKKCDKGKKSGRVKDCKIVYKFLQIFAST